MEQNMSRLAGKKAIRSYARKLSEPAVVKDLNITPLVDILEKHARKEKKGAELTGNPWEAQLMLVADQTTPYRLLTEVLYSCGQAGYGNYRLLVLKSRD